MILSHPHEDHVAGLALLLERYRIGRVFEPGMRGPGPGYAAWLGAARPPGRRPAGLAAGDRLAVDEIPLDGALAARGLVPGEPPDGGTGINNVSIVLLGTVGGPRFLLTGDVEEEIDPALLARPAPRRPAQGRASRQPDRHDPGVRRRRAPEGRDRVGRRRQPVRPPGAPDAGAARAAGARVLRTDRDGTVSSGFEARG